MSMMLRGKADQHNDQQLVVEYLLLVEVVVVDGGCHSVCGVGCNDY